MRGLLASALAARKEPSGEYRERGYISLKFLGVLAQNVGLSQIATVKWSQSILIVNQSQEHCCTIQY